MPLQSLNVFLALLLGGAPAATDELPPVVVASDAWEKCALVAAFAAWPRIPDDRAVAEHARLSCVKEARAFAELWTAQGFPTYPAGVTTFEQKIENAISRFWPSQEAMILKHLPEARKKGITKVKMRYRN